MNQEDVIKIFRDLPSSTQMKIRRSKMAPKQQGPKQQAAMGKEFVDKAPTQNPVPLPKPPENKRRSSLRGKVPYVRQEVEPLLSAKTEGIPSSEQRKAEEEPDARDQGPASKEIHQNGSRVKENSDEKIEKTVNYVGAKSSPEVKPTEETKPILDDVETNKGRSNTKRDKVKDELGDNLIIPSGYRKMTVEIQKAPNSTLGLSLVPSYGKLKGYFQVLIISVRLHVLWTHNHRWCIIVVPCSYPMWSGDFTYPIACAVSLQS